MLSSTTKRVQGINDRQDVEVHFATIIEDVPCDAQKHYGSIIASGLTSPQSWGNKVNVTGVRCSAVDASGLVQALGTACINLLLFTQRVGSDSEYSRDKVGIALEGYDGLATGVDYDEIDTHGRLSDLLINNDNEDVVNYALSVTGTASGVTQTNVALSMKGTVVW